MTTKKKTAPKGTAKPTAKPASKAPTKASKKVAPKAAAKPSKPAPKAAARGTSKTSSKAASKPATKASSKPAAKTKKPLPKASSKAAPKPASKPASKAVIKAAIKPSVKSASKAPAKAPARTAPKSAKPVSESAERFKLVPAPAPSNPTRASRAILPPPADFDDETDEDLLEDANNAASGDTSDADAEEGFDEEDSSNTEAEEAPEDAFDYSHVHTPGESTADRRRGQSLPFAIESARLLADDKCDNVLLLDTRELSSLTDFIVIGTGTSDRQMRSVLDHVEDLGAETGHKPYGVNADQRATWLLADFVDVVVHLFEPNTRAHYDLESKWAEAPRLNWERPAGSARPSSRGTIKPSPSSNSPSQPSDA